MGWPLTIFKMVTLDRWSYMTCPFPGGRQVATVNSYEKSKGREAREMAITCWKHYLDFPIKLRICRIF